MWYVMGAMRGVRKDCQSGIASSNRQMGRNGNENERAIGLSRSMGEKIERICSFWCRGEKKTGLAGCAYVRRVDSEAELLRII